jgi:hypothetical protein
MLHEAGEVSIEEALVLARDRPGSTAAAALFPGGAHVLAIAPDAAVASK